MTTNAQTRTRRDHSLWDKSINEQWGGLQPILSPEESLIAAQKLYRHAMGRKARKFTWELTSGNRHTWPRHGVFKVNPDERRLSGRGLREIIHSISHYCHWRLHPNDKPHSIRQVRLEAKLTKFAISRRWHEGTLKKSDKLAAKSSGQAEPEVVQVAKPDKVVLRYRRMVSRRDKWQQELKRAERLLAKATSEVRAYERRHGQRLQA